MISPLSIRGVYQARYSTTTPRSMTTTSAGCSRPSSRLLRFPSSLKAGRKVLDAGATGDPGGRSLLLIAVEYTVEFGAHTRVSCSPLLVLPHDYAHALTREANSASYGIKGQPIRAKGAYLAVAFNIAVSNFLV
jgi:hypothetical protein